MDKITSKLHVSSSSSPPFTPPSPTHIAAAKKKKAITKKESEIAEGASEEVLQEELENLSHFARASIEGKVTSKKISAWLKASSDHSNILALSQPEDHLQHDDRIDPYNDGDGYLSDSSFISNGDMTDPFTNHRTRPLRRAISLEDLSSAASIHHQLHSSGLLHQSRLRPISNTHSPHATSSPPEIATPHSVLSIQPPNSGSTSASESAIARTIEHMEFVPLKDKPQSNHDQDQDQDEEEEELEPYLLDRDRRDPTDIPTPDVSPEEMSDSSEDLVGQGDLAESRSSSLEGSHRQQRHHSYPRPGVALQGDEDSSSWSWLKDSPFLDALVNWIEGPDAVSQPKNQEKDKPNPWLDIPFQFIALLTYPEPDAKTGNKMTLTLRYCSFDFFMVVLFASNCAMLFLMKNSGRMNVNMAKRAVRQRVGWAKQWAGSIFKRGNNININNTNVPGMPPPHSRPSSTHRRGASQTTLNVNTTQAESLQNMQTSSGANASSLTIAPEISPQMKRRGLFGKKVAVGGHNH
ncbi:hypothetical protein BGZ74_011098 [Mortierella antarctica]|nr:hypothetical protein BGZ74_011098 [Mortierella antarctica]